MENTESYYIISNLIHNPKLPYLYHGDILWMIIVGYIQDGEFTQINLPVDYQ